MSKYTIKAIEGSMAAIRKELERHKQDCPGYAGIERHLKDQLGDLLYFKARLEAQNKLEKKR